MSRLGKVWAIGTAVGLVLACLQSPLAAEVVTREGPRPIVVNAYGLRTVDPATGRYVTTLTTGNEYSPLWSPNGRLVAYLHNYENGQEVGIVRADGSDHWRVTRNRRLDQLPSWSPNSKRLVLTRYNSRTAEVHPRLFVVRAKDGTERRLTPRRLKSDCPSWNPRAGLIAFAGVETDDIYLIKPDGSRLRKLTSGHRDYAPLWSPNGRRILFERKDDLFSIRRDGASLRRLTRDDILEGSAQWSPDGRRILFDGWTPENPDTIWVIASDGSKRRKILDDRNASSPTWSRNGRRVIYIRDGRRGGDVWSIRANGKSDHRLRRTRRADAAPHWYGRASAC